MRQRSRVGYALSRCVSMVSCALALIGCNSALNAPDRSETRQLDITGTGLDGTATPLFDSVEQTTGTVLKGASSMDVYVPVDSGSNDAYPLLILLQGARVDKSFYSNYAARISAHGFVVCVGNFPGPIGFFTSTSNVQAVLDYLADHAVDPSHSLFGRFDLERIGVIGHSFGGATALTLVEGDCNFPFCSDPFEKPETLGAVAVYGTHLVEPLGRVVGVNAKGTAIQMMFGAIDGVANRIDVEATFEAITNGAKHIVEIKGANHFAINDLDNPPGTVIDPNAPLTPQEQSIALTADWVGVFMRAHVAGDVEALAFLNGARQEDTQQYTTMYLPFLLQPSPQPAMPGMGGAD